MFATILVGVLAVGFAYLANFTDFKFGLKLSFLVIFVFLAIRYDFGNDYYGYYLDFIEINGFVNIKYFDVSYYYEPGWLLLYRLFSSLGFFIFVIVLAAFHSIIYYQFIKRYIPVKYYWFAVFIYVFNPSLMLIQASALRQSLATVIFLAAIPYIYKRQPVRYIILICIAYLFHGSALVLLPLYFLTFINGKINRVSGSIILVIFFSLFFLGKLIGPFINLLIQSNFERYEGYEGQAVIGTGLGIVYFTILFILILYYERFSNPHQRLIMKISMISFLFIPLSLLLQMMGRLAMYFEPSTLITYPIILHNIRKENHKLLFCLFVLIFTIYTFINFFNSELYGPYFGTYKTIFSVM